MEEWRLAFFDTSAGYGLIAICAMILSAPLRQLSTFIVVIIVQHVVIVIEFIKFVAIA